MYYRRLKRLGLLLCLRWLRTWLLMRLWLGLLDLVLVLLVLDMVCLRKLGVGHDWCLSWHRLQRLLAVPITWLLVHMGHLCVLQVRLSLLWLRLGLCLRVLLRWAVVLLLLLLLLLLLM
jgi:hypothetical protein